MLFIAGKQQKTILNFALDLLIVAEYYKQCNTHIHTQRERERERERESERETYTQKNLLNEASNFKFVTRN